MKKTIRFYFDFMSPYSYLASTQLVALAERHDAQIEYCPINVITLMSMVGNRPTSVECKPKGRYAMQDIARWAMKYKVPIQMNPHMRTINADMLILGAHAAANDGASKMYNEVVFRAVWAEAKSLTTTEDLALVMSHAAIQKTSEPSTVTNAQSQESAHAGIASYAVDMLSNLDDVKSVHDAMLSQAIQDGVFGVPSFVVGNTLFFENDRMDFLEHELSK
jgi:2-hydroxychromene-2-carboxylate isomerase